jgi:hypothetical protein
MKILSSFLLSASLTIPAFSQVIFQHAYQASVGVWTGFLKQTTDHGYIMAGDTRTWTAGGFDMYLVKADSLGAVQWAKSYGGTNDENTYTVVQGYDGGYLAAGHTNSFGNLMYAVKTDASGNLVWSKTYDSGDIYSVIKTVDSNYIFCGYGSSSVILIKVDTAGNILWEKRYGGSGFDIGYSVEQTHDTGFIIGGFTNSWGAGVNDYYLLKTDSTGALQWSKTYGGAGDEVAYCVHQTRDGGYILSGYSTGYGMGSYDFYVVKTDDSGNIVWNKTYGEAGSDYGSYITEGDENGYVIVGANTHTQNPYSLSMLGLDTQGNVIWEKGYAGSFLETWGFTIINTNDGGYAVGGYTEIPPDVEPSIMLIKTDAAGWAGCDFPTSVTVTIPVPVVTTPPTVTSPGGNTGSPATVVHYGWNDRMLCVDAAVNNISNANGKIAVYPNPIHANGEIKLTSFNSSSAILKIYNTLGAILREQIITGQSTVISREGLDNGIYFIRVSNNEGVWSGKVVVE